MIESDAIKFEMANKSVAKLSGRKVMIIKLKIITI